MFAELAALSVRLPFRNDSAKLMPSRLPSRWTASDRGGVMRNILESIVAWSYGLLAFLVILITLFLVGSLLAERAILYRDRQRMKQRRQYDIIGRPDESSSKGN